MKDVRWPQFAIKPGKEHPLLVDRFKMFNGKQGPGTKTFKFENAILIGGTHDECLRRGIPLTGLMGEMALRDPFTPEELKEWFNANPYGTGFSPRFPSDLLAHVASAATELEFVEAGREILVKLGIINTNFAVNYYKPYTTGARQLLRASLRSEAVQKVPIASYSDWIQSTGRTWVRSSGSELRPALEFGDF